MKMIFKFYDDTTLEVWVRDKETFTFYSHFILFSFQLLSFFRFEEKFCVVVSKNWKYELAFLNYQK